MPTKDDIVVYVDQESMTCARLSSEIGLFDSGVTELLPQSDIFSSFHATAPIGARFLTTVHTQFRAGSHNYRLLFGVPLRNAIVARADGYTVAKLSFAPGMRFALDLWRCNSYGTIHWRCFVCEAIAPGEEGEAVPFVRPAVRVLLHTKGAAQSRLFLAWLADWQALGLDPITCPRETFEAAHFRLQGSRADRTPPRRLSGAL